LKSQLVKTGDGSHTLFIPEANEHYHSYHGAIAESEHIFIKNGLSNALQSNTNNTIHILEIGLGTGLNVFLTFLQLLKYPEKTINYFALEPFPISTDVAEQLNYVPMLKAESQAHIFKLIHSSSFAKNTELSPQFALTKQLLKVEDFQTDKKFDIIYYDAFAPRVQPELWTKDIFAHLYSLMNIDAILLTYCAKGEVKRNMKSAGFKVESLPGPPGKREMVRAIKLV